MSDIREAIDLKSFLWYCTITHHFNKKNELDYFLIREGGGLLWYYAPGRKRHVLDSLGPKMCVVFSLASLILESFVRSLLQKLALICIKNHNFWILLFLHAAIWGCHFLRRVFIFGIFISLLEMIFSSFFLSFLFFCNFYGIFFWRQAPQFRFFLRKGWEVMFSVFCLLTHVSKMKKEFFLCKPKPNKTKLQKSFIANEFWLHKVFLSFFGKA